MKTDVPSKLPRIGANWNLKLSLTLLRYIGNWPPAKGNYRKIYYLYSLIFFTVVILIYLLVQTAFMISVWGDLEKMITGVSLLLTNAGNCYKMIVVLLRHERIDKLAEMVESQIFFAKDNDFEKIIMSYTWRGLFHHATYQSLGGFSISCWALASVLNIVKGGDRRLPVPSLYPFDTSASPSFELTCAHQIIGETILCFHNIALDTLITNFINAATCQLAILKVNVQSIGAEESPTSSEDARRRLNSCVEHNKAIIFFKKEIQDIFGTQILYQCFVNCAIICLTAFNISRMEVNAPAELMGTGLYLCGMAYQIFIYCWHGNELTLHSESVAFAAYSGNWWKFDERYKSTLRILMIRSRRPLTLTVGRVMVLSLDTFTSILRMSYSLFTVLQSSTTTD